MADRANDKVNIIFICSKCKVRCHYWTKVIRDCVRHDPIENRDCVEICCKQCYHVGLVFVDEMPHQVYTLMYGEP